MSLSGENFGVRIREVRQKKGLTQQQLARLLDVSLNTINRIEKGHRAPSAELVAQLGELFGCDTEWLLTGKESSDRSGSREQIPILSALPENFQTCPDLMVGWLSFPGQPSESFAVRVPDDAMSPLLKAGDYVLFQKESVTSGQIALLVDGWGEVRIRRLRQLKGERIFVSENPEYAALTGDDLRVVGRVVGGIREIKV